MIAVRETVATRESVHSTALPCVVFTLAGRFYAMPVTQVREVLRLPPVTPVPQAPPFVEGVISLRGRVIAVVDLRKRFELPVAAASASTRVIVVRSRGALVGLVVDSVNEVLTISSQAIQPLPAASTTVANQRFLSGVARADERLLVLLNLDELFTPEEGAQLAANAGR